MDNASPISESKKRSKDTMFLFVSFVLIPYLLKLFVLLAAAQTWHINAPKEGGGDATATVGICPQSQIEGFSQSFM